MTSSKPPFRIFPANFIVFSIFIFGLCLTQELIYTYELVRHGARAPMIGPGFPDTPKG